MTQDERWLVRYEEVKSFIEREWRNPSMYYPEERLIKSGRKLMNLEELQEPRFGMFKKLLFLNKQSKHVNQWI